MSDQDQAENELREKLEAIGGAARKAAVLLAAAGSKAKNTALKAAAEAMRAGTIAIIEANDKDVALAGEKGLSASMLDRLRLDAERVEAIASAMEAVAEQPDPVGRVLDERERPNGLKISRVAVPLGVIGIIYESRPNVTADAGALALKAGNAVILRGGSESFFSNRAIHICLTEGLTSAGLPKGAIQLIPVRDRAAVGWMLGAVDFIDVIIPRGGRSLIERVQNEARIPVLAHREGLCHVYVDGAADAEKAIAIAVNAKMRRTSVCGAMETLLIDRKAAHMVPDICRALEEAGCELRGDEAAQALFPSMTAASDEDWSTEYLDGILSIAMVEGVAGAMQHIARYGSNHTDSIVTEDLDIAAQFLAEVDSAIVMHNASTQFADGGEFGMGAEIGISTGRLHARGPVGVEQLTTYKYVVRGDGQIRP
ncbi:MAG: glutamate-5-semialdehyde dehydrogenase [Proteobacteria bacterium]|nr:glutamate-5-semialdehyde dehydrogenase [Pseudomonadota bacterium]